MPTVLFPGPKIEISGISLEAASLTEQSWRWSLVPGVVPYYYDFVVPIGEINEQLEGLENPVSMKLVAYGGIQGAPEFSEILVENLYLQKPRYIDDWFVQWQVADARFLWNGQKVFANYNRTRIRNEVSLLTGTEELTFTDPARLRSQYDRFAQGRYLPWSVKSDGSPYNVYEILKDIIEQSAVPFLDIPEEGNYSYIFENIRFDGIDYRTAILKLCEMSRLNIGINLKGELYIYSYDFFDGLPLQSLDILGAKTKPGNLYQQDLHRIRPNSVNVRFEIKQEVLFVASEMDEGNVRVSDGIPNRNLEKKLDSLGYSYADYRYDRRVLSCVNVMPVPYPIRSTITGQKFNIGEYVPMEEFLLAFGLTIDDVRNLYFSDLLNWKITRVLTGGQRFDQNSISVANQITAVIKRHFRMTYQMDPYFVNQIESWEPRRCAVVDNYSRYSPPSPVWMDYAYIPAGRPPLLSQNIGLYDNKIINYTVAENDPDRTQTTLPTINILSHPLGIFSASFPPQYDSMIKSFIPSKIENPPAVQFDGNTLGVLKNSYLSEEHTFETLLSVVWATDSFGDFSDSQGAYKYYSFRFDYGGKGPNVTILNRQEYARRATRSRDVLEEGADLRKPVNLAVLNAIAGAESARVYHQYVDRVVGLVRFAGFKDSVTLRGNIKYIMYMFSAARGLETEIDMREIPPIPTLEQKVTASTLAFLHRQIPRGDNQNDMGSPG